MVEQTSQNQGTHSSEEITSDSPFTLPGFFAALSEDHLLAGQCGDCSKMLLPPRIVCYACGSRNIQIEEQPKTGKIITYTEVRKPPSAFAGDAPFTVAVVELDSGARLTGRVTASYQEVDIDMPVRLTIRELNENEKAFALSYEIEWPLHIFKPI